MRTFVFISNIPDFLLQPIYTSEAKNEAGESRAKKSPASSKFDLRYERLRRLLVEHSSGVMLVMHLETKGYALALYASEGEALAACKADITPEQPGQKFSPLRLRILEKEKPLPPEPVYNPLLTVEGEEVRKVDLADTRGLELVYRGRALAKWCPRTLAGEDCHFGVACLKLHRAAVQRTVRKRPRIDEEDAEATLSADQLQTVRQLLASVKAARAALAPASLEMKNCIYVPVSVAEMAAVVRPGATASASRTADEEAAHQAVLHRVEQAMSSSSSSPPTFFFPRLSCPGGAPWEWTLESAEGRRVLRERCPLPANGAPTPLERDLYIQKLWYHMNALNRCRSAQDVLRMLQGSRRVSDALRRCAAGGEEQDAACGMAAQPRTEGTAKPSSWPGGATELYICLEPWLYLPTVGCEVTVFLERGGRRVRGVVQRYGQLRLMTSATLLATSAAPLMADGEDVDALLSRYAVLDAESDAAAEESLSTELRSFQRCVAAAVGDVTQHLQRHLESTGGESAAWCLHLAVELPYTSSSSWSALAPLPSSSALSSPPLTRVSGATPSAVLISCTPYHQALEECSLYSALAPTSSSSAGAAAEAADAVRLGPVEVTWNTKRHPYIPLFSRDVLEKLRADVAE